MFRFVLTLLLVQFAASGQALSADPILGDWMTPAGATATISACGQSFCVKLKNGPHAGRQIGSLTNTGKRYEGTVTDPRNDKTYKGRATIAGNVLKLSGCVLGGLFCRSQKWTKL